MGLNQNYQLDDLDLQILDILIKDCRTPYLEIARMCHVSGGTIHVRMKKMEDLYQQNKDKWVQDIVSNCLK